MPPIDDWTGEERRRILERRRQARQEERDRQAEEAERAGLPIPQPIPGPTPEQRAERRNAAERRQAQICFVCRDEFTPTSAGQTICERCQMDGVRGGGRNGWRSPRF
jgi:hypothetical protein